MADTKPLTPRADGLPVSSIPSTIGQPTGRPTPPPRPGAEARAADGGPASSRKRGPRFGLTWKIFLGTAAVVTLVLGLMVGAVTTVLVLDGVIPLAVAWPGVGRVAWEVVLYVVLFDGYFYGLHRLLHTRLLYRRIHAVHHRSRAPTVVTALAFHPLEALLVFGFMPVAMWLVPIHLVSVAAVSVFLSGSIALAHCGYEIFPPWWERVPVLGWYVTPRVHDAHHVHRSCNFSATLAIFDRVFGTLRPGHR
jgi:sterol desaturase/sphingolipid hydroxylase (fatty acid hydroxylase superfamily)